MYQISTTAIPLKTLALEIARIPANRKVILLDIMRHQPEVTSGLTPEKRGPTPGKPTPGKLVTELRDQLSAAPSSADTLATNYERKLAGLSADNWTQGKERDAFLAQVPAFSPLLAHSFSELAQLPSASSARSSTSDRRPGSGTDTRGEVQVILPFLNFFSGLFYTMLFQVCVCVCVCVSLSLSQIA